MKTLVKTCGSCYVPECGSCYVPEALPSGGQRARSSAGEHHVDIVGVAGSIPVVPTTACFCKGRLRKGTGRERRHTSRCSLQTRACGFGLPTLRMFRYLSYMDRSTIRCWRRWRWTSVHVVFLCSRLPPFGVRATSPGWDEFRLDGDAPQGARNISNDDLRTAITLEKSSL